MKKGLYNLFGIPYFHAYISKNGEVFDTKVIRMDEKTKDFVYKKVRFILPDYRKKETIPPLKKKSGYLTAYDINSAVPMKLVTSRAEGIEWMDEETRKEYVVNPRQFYLTPLDAQELNDYLESKTVQDILSDDEKQFPMWLVIIIVTAVIAIGLIAVVYLITHAPPTVIEKFIQANVTAIPTMYMR